MARFNEDDEYDDDEDVLVDDAEFDAEEDANKRNARLVSWEKDMQRYLDIERGQRPVIGYTPRGTGLNARLEAAINLAPDHAFRLCVAVAFNKTVECGGSVLLKSQEMSSYILQALAVTMLEKGKAEGPATDKNLRKAHGRSKAVIESLDKRVDDCLAKIRELNAELRPLRKIGAAYEQDRLKIETLEAALQKANDENYEAQQLLNRPDENLRKAQARIHFLETKLSSAMRLAEDSEDLFA